MAHVHEMLHENSLAEALYETVIEITPYNAIAHANLGMLLLGTGNRNYAAVHACGLNQKKALFHLRTAYNLDAGMKVQYCSC
jgi:Tfp pilus assembly protein PilF